MGRVQGKVAVVTGGAMGIGKATAIALAREGARVMIGDIDEMGGNETAQQAYQEGGEAHFQRTDVGVSNDVEQLLRSTVAHFGGVDVLANIVGVAIPGSVTDMSEEEWNRVININLTGVWRGMKYTIPEMIKGGGGSIINMSSVQALVGFPDWAGYAASKGGINALTQQAAAQFAPHNVRVNAVAPGTIMTPMNQRIFKTSDNAQDLIDAWNRQHALGRFGQPEEVAELVVFLASDESSFITGDVIRVDGGLVIKGP